MNQPELKLLPDLFWGDGGEYVVVYRPPDPWAPRGRERLECYGPFYNLDVAHAWSGDMWGDEGSIWLLAVRPPPDPPRPSPKIKT